MPLIITTHFRAQNHAVRGFSQTQPLTLFPLFKTDSPKLCVALDFFFSLSTTFDFPQSNFKMAYFGCDCTTTKLITDFWEHFWKIQKTKKHSNSQFRAFFLLWYLFTLLFVKVFTLILIFFYFSFHSYLFLQTHQPYLVLSLHLIQF